MNRKRFILNRSVCLTSSRVLAIGAACMGLSIASQSAKAQQVLNINFDGDTTGMAPSTNLATTPFPRTQPYAIGGYDYNLDPNNGNEEIPPTAADGTIVVSGASKNTTWATNPGDNQNGALWMDTQYSTAAATFQLKFDLNVNAATQNAWQTYTLLSDSSTVHPVFGVNTFSTGNSLDFNAVPTSSTGGVYGIRTAAGIEPFFNYTNGDDHTIEMDANYLTGWVNVLVDGTPELTAYAFGSPSGGVNISETFLYLSGDTSVSPISNSVSVDNISATVPEPASLSCLAIGGLGLLRRRRSAR
jgi:hypothetical protein